MYWNYNLGIFNYCMSMGDLVAYISVHHVHAGTYAGQKRAQGSWEPEVQTIVRDQVGAGEWAFRREASTQPLNRWGWEAVMPLKGICGL